MTYTLHQSYRFALLILMTVAIAFVAAGCGDTDADGGGRDTGPAKARINMPDNFPTVAHKCYSTTGVYVTNSAEASPGGLAILADDPQCR